jgi:hypothetical protein
MRYSSMAALVTMALLQVHPLQPQEIITKVTRSSLKTSGVGHEFSEWYVLESDVAPPGYYLSDAQLTLEGSNTCGGNAQCLEGERTPTQSTWLFRLQGSGNASKIPSSSVAVLKTTYRKLGDVATYTLTVATKVKFSSRGGFFGCFDSAADATAHEGPWCFLRAPPPKPGYRVRSASFSLQGDRSCVGNDSDREPDDPSAWCRLVTRTDQEVVWQFKMQGHTEGPVEDPGSSLGRLVVIYEKNP